MRLAREGHLLTMFPEGTRRRKGLVKRFEARPRSGAARIALEAGVPLVPAAVSGTDKLLRFGKIRVAYGPPVEIDDLRGGDVAEAASEATERLMARILELEESLLSALLAVDGDSFAHRAYHALPKSIALNAVVGFTNMCRGSGRPSGRTRCSSPGTRSRRRRTGTGVRRVPVGPRLRGFAARAARAASGA